MGLRIERSGPLGEPLLGKRLIFSGPALGEPLEVPALRICLRLEQTFFVAGFNKAHDPNRTTSAPSKRPRSCDRGLFITGGSRHLEADADREAVGARLLEAERVDGLAEPRPL